MAPLLPSLNRPLHPAVHRELVDLLHTALPQVFAISITASTAAIVLAVQSGDPAYAIIGALLVAAAAFRVVGLRRFPHDAVLSPAEVLKWERLYGGGAAAFGLALGLLSWRTLDIGDQPAAWITFGLSMSFCVGMVSRAAVRPWIVLVTAALLLAPTVIGGFSRPELAYKLGAAMLLFFWMTLREASRHLSTAFIERIEAKLELAHRANHDALTGLPNRAAFTEALAGEAQVEGGAFAIVAIDLDGFKPVNDRLGHHVGDALLRQVAQRLRSCAGSRALAARIGGDEFMLLLRFPDGRADAEPALRLARKAVKSLGKPFDLDGPIRIGASAGILLATAQDAAGDADGLLASVDEALYVAKRNGGGRWHLAGTPDPDLEAGKTIAA